MNAQIQTGNFQMKSHTHALILAGLFAALTAVGAFIKFPLGAMSFTLQLMFTALAGVLLGPKWGPASQAVYVALGLIGLPIFTMGGGLGYLLQPSMGFLLGLIPGAWVVGLLTRKKISHLTTALASIAGFAVIYLIGIPYMYLILNVYLGKGLPLSTVLWTGMIIYLPGDALKAAVVTIAAPPLVNALKKTM